MVRNQFGIALSALALTLVVGSSFSSCSDSAQGSLDSTSSKVIYGSDDRLDLYQVKDANWKRIASSTVALMKQYELSDSLDDSGLLDLHTSPYGSGQGLCTDEPFYEQVSGAFCSGSLVGPDLVMTAGHCIENADDCASTKFVFDFAYRAQGAWSNQVRRDQVYQCRSILKQRLESGEDYALVFLDRPVRDRAPLEISRTGKIEIGTPLVVIGHPSGLPTKLAGGARVRSNAMPGYFVANLDTYGGNSGSAVFNAETGLIEGILVRGEADFEMRTNGMCMASKRCLDDGCRGEDVTKISLIADIIPALSGTTPSPRPVPSLAPVTPSPRPVPAPSLAPSPRPVPAPSTAPVVTPSQRPVPAPSTAPVVTPSARPSVAPSPWPDGVPSPLPGGGVRIRRGNSWMDCLVGCEHLLPPRQ